MSSSRTGTAAFVVLFFTIALSITLACVGFIQNAPLPTTGDESPATSSEAVSAKPQFTVGEAEYIPEPEPEPEPDPKPESLAYLATNSDILSISSSKDPISFALADGDSAPTLSDDASTSITSTMTKLLGEERVGGFLLIDLETGRGVVSGADERVFGASAIKAPFVHFMCERWLDAGKASLDDKVTIDDKEMTLKEAIEDAVIKSGNDSYKMLFNTYNSGWSTWLQSMGISGKIDPWERNPSYTARESAVMWLEIYRYISEEASADNHAEWLGSMISSTQVSFMRHAIADNNTKVASKPGWYATPEGSEYKMDGFCEAGIINEDGHCYLLTLMTDVAYKGALEDEFENVIQAIWAARSDFATK